MEKQFYRLNIVAYHNSANCNFVSFDFRKNIHIAGRNNIGKTAKLNGLQIGYLPHMTFKGSDRKFNFDKDYTDESSYDFYFPDQNSYIVFEFENPHGIFCQIVYKGSGDLAIERAFVPLSYNEVLTWLWSFEENDEIGKPTRINRKELISKISSTKGHKILKVAKDAMDLMFNGSLTNYDLGKFSIASVDENRRDNVLDLLKISSNVGSIDSVILRKTIVSLLNSGYQDNKKDAIKYDPNSLMDQFSVLRREKEFLTQKKNYLEKYNSIKSSFSSLKQESLSQNFQFSLLSHSIGLVISKSSKSVEIHQEKILLEESNLIGMKNSGQTVRDSIKNLEGEIRALKSQQYSNLETKEQYDKIMHSDDSHWRIASGNPESAIELMDQSILFLNEQIKDAKNIDKTIKDLRKLESSQKSLISRKENVQTQIENIGNLLISNHELKNNSGKLATLNSSFSSVKDNISSNEIELIRNFLSIFTVDNKDQLVFNGVSFGTVLDSVRSTEDLTEELEDIESELRHLQKEIDTKMKTVDSSDKNLLQSLTKDLDETNLEKKIVIKYMAIKDIFEKNNNDIEEKEIHLANLSEQYSQHRQKYKELSDHISGLKIELKILKDTNSKNIAVRSELEMIKSANNYTFHSVDIKEKDFINEIEPSHISEIKNRFASIREYKLLIGNHLREFLSLGMINDSGSLLMTSTYDYDEIEKALVGQLDDVFSSLESDEASLNDAFLKQAHIIMDVSGDLEHYLNFYKSYIKKLNRQLEKVSLSSVDSIFLEIEFHPRIERFVEVIANMGLDSDNALSAMDNGLEEVIRSFIIDMGLDKNKSMTINIDTMIQKINLKYINEHNFITNKGSNGTSIITSILLLSMFTREICGEDVSIIMPINLDEIASVDRSNLDAVSNFIKSKGFSLFSASPSIPSSAIDLFDVIIPLEDFENTSSDRLVSKSKMTYHHEMLGLLDDDNDDIQLIDYENEGD